MTSTASTTFFNDNNVIAFSIMLLLVNALSVFDKTTGNPYFSETVGYDDLALKLCRDDKPDNKYSIHGWWPEYREGKWPQWCDPSRYSEFNNSAISHLMQDLNRYWYACPEWKTSSYELWQHEWEKHGTCIKNTDVANFFSHTLDAFQKAMDNNWYGCCIGQNQCLLPYSKYVNETTWLGYCHHTASKKYIGMQRNIAETCDRLPPLK